MSNETPEEKGQIHATSPDYYEINDYGLIGDLHTVALINQEGGIDWCCLPYLDSSSIFAKLLDTHRGGSFKISPTHFIKSTSSYLSKTNILQTTFQGADSRVVLTDFMPILSPDGKKEHMEEVFICRQVECEKGQNVEITVHFDPQPDYALTEWPLSFQPKHVTCNAMPINVIFDRPLRWDEKNRTGTVHLSYGETLHCIFSYGVRELKIKPDYWLEKQFYTTRKFWEKWVAKCLYTGRWRQRVQRSALALKLMIFQPTGAIAAATTTSLPEDIGGIRNWDYRFSWLRDSALTLNALFLLGYKDEATAYMTWLIGNCDFSNNQELKILAPLSKQGTTEERILEHLEGYKASRPVRIGNAAVTQLQLDIYGELLDCIYLYSVYGEKLHPTILDSVQSLATFICEHWHEKDSSIWEVRGELCHYTYSKLMCWVGLDRAIRIAEDYELNLNLHLFKATQEKIEEFLLKTCIDNDKQYFVQSPERPVADASNLLIPIFGFLSPHHQLMTNTIDQTLIQLTRNHMVLRYDTEDGLEGSEGTFNLCTFWLVEALALAGRVEEAMVYFGHMLEIGNHLGLFAEQTEQHSMSALGNFPQAFTHIGLINSALTLNQINNKHRTAGGAPS
jgi:GH15 family glucan-1,4-alpha-glucosidase